MIKYDNELIEKYIPLMKSTAGKYIYNFHDKEDLIQDLCIKINGCLKKYDKKRGVEFAGYLKKSFENYSKDFLDKKIKSYYCFESIDDLTDDQLMYLDTIESEKEESEIEKLFDEIYINHPYGYLANLRYIQGYNINEIAREFELSPKTINKRLKLFCDWFKEQYQNKNEVEVKSYEICKSL